MLHPAFSDCPGHELWKRDFKGSSGLFTFELHGDPEAFVDSLDAANFDDSASREIVLRAGTPKEKRLTGTNYLLRYGLPQFFFHVTTAYALLRHNGVEIGKRDYMGAY